MKSLIKTYVHIVTNPLIQKLIFCINSNISYFLSALSVTIKFPTLAVNDVNIIVIKLIKLEITV